MTDPPLNIFDHVLNSKKLQLIFPGNFNAEFFLELKNKIKGIQRIDLEVFNQIGLYLNIFGLCLHYLCQFGNDACCNGSCFHMSLVRFKKTISKPSINVSDVKAKEVRERDVNEHPEGII